MIKGQTLELSAAPPVEAQDQTSRKSSDKRRAAMRPLAPPPVSDPTFFGRPAIFYGGATPAGAGRVVLSREHVPYKEHVPQARGLVKAKVLCAK